MKFEEKHKDLLDTGSMISRGYCYLAANAGKAIALITLLVAALVTFTEVAFADLSRGVITPTVLTLLIASYTMYFSLEDAGERLGEESEEYKAALERYSGVRAKITADMIPALREFCSRYSSEELTHRRSTLMLEHGVSEQEYRDYLSGASVEWRRGLILKKIKNMKSTALTPTLLLSRERRRAASELKNPDGMKLPSMLLKMIPTTLCTFFTASLILTTKESLTAETVLDGILKLSSLPVVGFRGYTSGYSYVKGRSAGWLDMRASILESFLSEIKSGTQIP